MTESKAIQKLKDQLCCSICLDTYTDPKLLECCHLYCRRCLVRLVNRDQQGQLILPCPTCRQVTHVPANGVAGLQSAYHITALLKLMDNQSIPVSAECASVECVNLAPPVEDSKVLNKDFETANRKIFQKLEDLLNCSICLDTYTDPRLLRCFHVYCHKCLVRLWNQTQQGQLLSCPICRQDTPLPAYGVAGLQSASFITPLLEILKEHKKPIPDDDPPVKVFCRGHVLKEVELFCVTCDEPICLKCSVAGGRHFGHKTELLKKAFEKYKGEIAPLVEAMEKQLATINNALPQIDEHRWEISDQQAAIESNLCGDIDRFHQLLDTRKTKLSSQLHQTTRRKLKNLAVQKDDIETTQAQLMSCLEVIQRSLRTDYSEIEALMMKTTIVKQAKELITTFSPDMLRPDAGADMVFSSSPGIITACQNYGQVSTLSSAPTGTRYILIVCILEGHLVCIIIPLYCRSSILTK